MSQRTYPYTAWVLKPSFKPVQTEIVRSYESFSHPNTWDVAIGGKLYSVEHEIFPTKEAAIAAGWVRVHGQEAKLAKMQAGIDKKREALAKAAG